MEGQKKAKKQKLEKKQEEAEDDDEIIEDEEEDEDSDDSPSTFEERLQAQSIKAVAFWDEEFEKEDEKEWIASYDDIQELLLQILKPLTSSVPCLRVLVVGAGTSLLSVHLYHDLVKLSPTKSCQMISTDVSQVAMDKMRQKYTDPGLEWLVADITNLDDSYAPDSFDLILDKGAADSLLFRRGGKLGKESAKRCFTEVHRVLKADTGKYVVITPRRRFPFLTGRFEDALYPVPRFHVETTKFNTKEWLIVEASIKNRKGRSDACFLHSCTKVSALSSLQVQKDKIATATGFASRELLLPEALRTARAQFAQRAADAIQSEKEKERMEPNITISEFVHQFKGKILDSSESSESMQQDRSFQNCPIYKVRGYVKSNRKIGRGLAFVELVEKPIEEVDIRSNSSRSGASSSSSSSASLPEVESLQVIFDLHSFEAQTADANAEYETVARGLRRYDYIQVEGKAGLSKQGELSLLARVSHLLATQDSRVVQVARKVT